ncbi:MAG: hypothetical protein H6662_10780 [Ardenticatenaceae bacterium]|nr:hypothetical protein [Anaerolineales bacterium]MCB8922060.1 hypothetical protein [Ardenticatenaceae bacterium]MCB9003177.1 hypothetical protein [Ardenticatenaceae bacterium]
MKSSTNRLGVLPSLILGAALCAIGLLTLTQIVDNWWPMDVARIDLIRDTGLGRIDAPTLLDASRQDIIIAFLGAVLVTITGLALPLTYFLNKRFGRETRFPPFLVTLRQAMWVGLWGAFCTFLQMNRAFGVAIALLVAFFFLLIEAMLQIRTQVTEVVS